MKQEEDWPGPQRKPSPAGSFPEAEEGGGEAEDHHAQHNGSPEAKLQIDFWRVRDSEGGNGGTWTYWTLWPRETNHKKEQRNDDKQEPRVLPNEMHDEQCCRCGFISYSGHLPRSASRLSLPPLGGTRRLWAVPASDHRNRRAADNEAGVRVI